MERISFELLQTSEVQMYSSFKFSSTNFKIKMWWNNSTPKQCQNLNWWQTNTPQIWKKEYMLCLNSDKWHIAISIYHSVTLLNLWLGGCSHLGPILFGASHTGQQSLCNDGIHLYLESILWTSMLEDIHSQHENDSAWIKIFIWSVATRFQITTHYNSTGLTIYTV